MVIELLKFQVSPEVREKFIQKDEEIWTKFLASCQGFLGKEVWINPHTPSEVILVIHWENRELWKSISQISLAQTQAKFEQEVGQYYPIQECLEYQVRKLQHL